MNELLRLCYANQT